MGCLLIIANRVGDSMPISCTRKDVGLGINASRDGIGIHASFQREGPGLSLKSKRLGQGLSICCSPVCDLGVSLYLKVTPEILWLVDDEGLFLVSSNVNWEVYNQ